ncbi:unnamed protein product [Thlaspi arvense]|uniref:F-box domain-containing protein n=1 Tax=Thlaspi arvense TaxID=13288 RepID=A0AAU9SBP2_THLAR|nr:unnamed protein product [Thlaspi arvense]
MSRNRCDWSKLCPDVCGSILERLSAKDFHRARTVCSNWYSVSRTCKLYPWRIQFNECSTSLFDPVEDKKIHETEHPGIEFSKSYVMASCSNWLLVVDFLVDLYLLNVFTSERISVPSMESMFLGQARFQGEDDWEQFIKRTNIASFRKSTACLWINERTRDYVIAWSYKEHYLFTYKIGDDSWCNLEGTQCKSMAYKNNKLYVYTSDHYIKTLDLSKNSPNEIVEGNPYRSHRFHFVSKPKEYIWKKRIAITSSGEVLIVVSLKGLAEKRYFYVFKMNVGSGNWERVDSLGGEMLIFGHGHTIRAPIKEINGEGIKGDSICFDDDDLMPGSDYLSAYRKINCGVFDLATSTITWSKTLDAPFLKSSWFVPGYDQS